MNGIICNAPKGGGSAGNLARYLFGYTMSSKKQNDGLSKAERAAQYRDLHAESLMRDDLGVGEIWEPVAGTSNGRLAAVMVNNVTSFATFDEELETWAAVGKNARVHEPTLHLIFSFSPEETKTLSNVKMVQAARTALITMGLGDHAQSLSLHMDEPHGHVHCAVSAMNPNTMMTWERYRDQFHISDACRDAELKHGLRHDPGLIMIEINNGIKIKRESTRAERAARQREGAEARLDHETLKAQGDFSAFESKESYAEVVEVAIRERSDKLIAEGLPATYTEAHRIAASYGARLTQRDGELWLDIRTRLTPEERKEIADKANAAKLLQNGYETRRVEAPRTRSVGERVKIDAAQLGIAVPFESVEDAELSFAQVLADNPSYVSRVLTNVDGFALINRGAVDKFVASRVTDPDLIARLGDHVLANDHEIEMVTADRENPMYVQMALRDMQNTVSASATRLANTKDASYDAAAFDRSIDKLQQIKRAEQTAKGQKPDWTITAEQRDLCAAIAQNRLTWCDGNAGSGKTTVMATLKLYAQETGRPIIGLATGQAATRKLAKESGVTCYNLTKLRLDEARGKQILPPNAIVLIDESSMTSYRALRVVTDLAEKRHATIAGIGDGAQIANIEAGNPHIALREIAQLAGTYRMLEKVRRQQGELAWMAPEVERSGEAIRTGDSAGVERFIEIADQHGVFEICESREETIRAAADWYLAKRDVETVITTKDRFGAKHGNQMVREGLGLQGTGTPFRFDRGTIEVAVGDRVQFGRNAPNLKVDNSDLGTITAVSYNKKTNKWAITTRVDRSGEETKFDPQVYQHLTHGYFVTATKSQGQSVPRCAAIADLSSDANTMHVQMTRSTHELKVFFSQTSFPDASALGKHLGSRIQAKDDYLQIQRVIAMTGGPDTHWAKKMEKAIANNNDPYRRQWVAQQRVQREALEEQKIRVAIRLQGEMRLAKTKEGRDAILRRLARENKQIDAQLDRIAKQTFVGWACERKLQEDRDAQRMGVVRQEWKAQAAKKALETTKKHRPKHERLR